MVSLYFGVMDSGSLGLQIDLFTVSDNILFVGVGWGKQLATIMYSKCMGKMANPMSDNSQEIRVTNCI